MVDLIELSLSVIDVITYCYDNVLVTHYYLSFSERRERMVAIGRPRAAVHRTNPRRDTITIATIGP